MTNHDYPDPSRTIRQYLLQAMQTGEYAHSDRLPRESVLAEKLGISRTPMREALLMLNLARMVDIKPQSGTHVAPINLKLMEMEQFARYTLEKEILNRLRGHVTPRQEEEYRSNIETYRVLEADMSQPDRTVQPIMIRFAMVLSSAMRLSLT